MLESTSQYECINEANSCIGGYKLNNLPTIESCEEKCQLFEGIDWQTEQHEKGGIIVFSTDVNAVELDGNKIKNWVKQKTATIKNCTQYKGMVDKVAHKNEPVGWTIGKYLNGRYRAKNGKTFSENSLSLEIIGVDILFINPKKQLKKHHLILVCNKLMRVVLVEYSLTEKMVLL